MLDDDRRGETAIDRNQRGSADIVELERLLLRGEPYETFFASRETAEWIEQPQAKRNEPWPAFDRRQQLPEGYGCPACVLVVRQCAIDTRGSCRSEEHTSELQSLMRISYAVFCLKQKLAHCQYATSSNTILINCI